MRDSVIVHLVIIFLAIVVIFFLINARISNLADRVLRIELDKAVEETKETVNRGRGTGWGIGGNICTGIGKSYSNIEVGDRTQISGGGTAYRSSNPWEYHIGSGIPGGTGRSGGSMR